MLCDYNEILTEFCVSVCRQDSRGSGEALPPESAKPPRGGEFSAYGGHLSSKSIYDGDVIASSNIS